MSSANNLGGIARSGWQIIADGIVKKFMRMFSARCCHWRSSGRVVEGMSRSDDDDETLDYVKQQIERYYHRLRIQVSHEVAAAVAEQRRARCIMCMKDGPTSCFYPCGHLMCSSCTAEGLQLCQLCRQSVSSIAVVLDA
mmetsp:Transcript_21047/g.53164  ORF Transcript_21047/g.53164 Transcript_21047/m.53164 type:complete len:139 (-) Transcript_21047:196-612(-)